MIPLLVGLASAGELQPLFSGQNTPWTIGARNGAIGLGRPLTWGYGDRTDVTIDGRWFLVAPQAEVKRTVWEKDGWAVGAMVGAGVPTFGLRQLQTGFLQLVAGDQTIPWVIVPTATVLGGRRYDDLVVSARVQARFGIPVTEGDLQFQDLAWFDPLIAPIVNGWALEIGARADWLPNDKWVLTADARVELSGGPDLAGKLFALRSLGNYVAVGAGVAGAWEKYSYGYPDWDDATVPQPPVPFVNVVPLVDVQTRW